MENQCFWLQPLRNQWEIHWEINVFGYMGPLGPFGAGPVGSPWGPIRAPWGSPGTSMGPPQGPMALAPWGPGRAHGPQGLYINRQTPDQPPQWRRYVRKASVTESMIRQRPRWPQLLIETLLAMPYSRPTGPIYLGMGPQDPQAIHKLGIGHPYIWNCR